MKKAIFVALIPALLVGCAATTAPTDFLELRSSANAHTSIRNTHHHDIIGDYSHREPVDPKPWRQQNDDRAPQTTGKS